MGALGRPLQHAFTDHWHYFEAAQHLRDMAEVAAMTERFACSLGFETHGFAHKAVSRPDAQRDTVRTFHNYRNEFGHWYRRLHTPVGPESDARVLHARSGLPVIAWNVRGDFNYKPHAAPVLRARARRQVQLAGDFNMRGGITLPATSRSTEWAFLTLSTGGAEDVAN